MSNVKTTQQFLKYYDVSEPINYVDLDDNSRMYKYGAIDILDDAERLLCEKDNRIKELEKKSGEVELVVKLEMAKTFESIWKSIYENSTLIMKLCNAVLGYKGTFEEVDVDTITNRIKKALENKE